MTSKVSNITDTSTSPATAFSSSETTLPSNSNSNSSSSSNDKDNDNGVPEIIVISSNPSLKEDPSSAEIHPPNNNDETNKVTVNHPQKKTQLQPYYQRIFFHPLTAILGVSIVVLVILVLIFLVIVPPTHSHTLPIQTPHQSVSSCPSASPHDDIPDDIWLQRCLNNGGIHFITTSVCSL